MSSHANKTGSNLVPRVSDTMRDTVKEVEQDFGVLLKIPHEFLFS